MRSYGLSMSDHLPVLVRRSAGLGLLLAAVLAILSGCSKPVGTCMADGIPGEDIEFCKLGIREDHCRGTFYEEDSTAGMLRCRGEGYTSNTPAADMRKQLEEGGTVTFSRTKSP